MEKMETLKKNGDQMGTKKLILVPMGTKVPKWGPMWEQCRRKPVPIKSKFIQGVTYRGVMEYDI